MVRPTSEVLTERESEIMQVLWQCDDASPEEVRNGLPGEPHDSSVRTILRILVKKGYVVADMAVRPTRYSAAIPQAKLQNKAAKSLLKRFFGGNAEDLVVRLLEDEQLTHEQLDAIRRKVSRQKRKGKTR